MRVSAKDWLKCCAMNSREKRQGDRNRGKLTDEDRVGDMEGLEISVIRTDIMVKIEQENWKNGGLC